MIVIQLKREMPYHLLALQRLHRRLPQNHPKYLEIQQELYYSKAGYGGEEYIDSILSTIHFPIPHLIFPNLHLSEKSIPSTQMDLFIFTPSYALIIEVKNWTGTITFQDTGQALQSKNDQINGMDCPTVQADTYRENLIDWFAKHKISIPVHRVVLFPFASTILMNAENKGIHFAKELPLILRKLNRYPAVMDSIKFNVLKKKLIQGNRPFSPSFLCHKYGIKPEDLLKGLYCSICGGILKKQSSRLYGCSVCCHAPDNPILETMLDWFLLFGHHLTNKELQSLSGITSAKTIGYFMRISGFPRSGTTKGTAYHYNEIERQKYLLNSQKL